MDVRLTLLIALGSLALLLFSAKVLSAPVALTVRVALNTALGLGALLLVNAASALTGLTLGVNLFNAAVVGILGIPGLGLLFLAQWVFT